MPTPDHLWIATAAVLFLGLVAALAGFRPLPKTGRRCRRCGYDLVGTPDSRHRCPECGNALAGGVVLGVSSESGVQWRRRLRRAGVSLGTLALLLAVAAFAFDARRLPWTPTWFLAGVDGPIACRVCEDRSPWAAAVYETITDRMTATTPIDTELVRRIAEPLLPRMEGADRVPAGARRFVLFAWGVGVVTDAELVAIESIWPEPFLVINGPPSVDGLDLNVSLRCPLDVAPIGSRLSMLGADWTAMIGDEVVSRTRTHSMRGWPQAVNPNASSSTGLLHSELDRLELEPGEVEVRVRRRYRLIARSADGRETRVVGERDIEFADRFTIPEPPPLPELVDDSARLAAVADALEAGSWAERQAGGVLTITIATRSPENLDLATPDFAWRPGNADGLFDWEALEAISLDALAIDDSRFGSRLARLAHKRPIDGRLVHRIRVATLFAPEVDDDSSTLLIRLDTTNLDPRYWRRLIANHPDEDIPDTLPAGIVEFEIPIVEVPDS